MANIFQFESIDHCLRVRETGSLNLSNLSEDDFNRLQLLVWEEGNNRARQAINAGTCPNMNEYEVGLIRSSDGGTKAFIEAIKAYRIRTGASLKSAKMLADEIKNSP